MSNHYSKGLGKPFNGNNDITSTSKRRHNESEHRFCDQKDNNEMSPQKESVQQLRAQVDTQDTKIKEQELKIKELEEQNKKMLADKVERSKNFKKYLKSKDDAINAKEVEKIVAINTAEDQFKRQLENKQKEINGLKAFVDKNKALETTVQQLKKEISALNKKIKEKNIQLEGVGDSLQTTEQLKKEKIKDKKEITGLKRSKQYFQNTNENNKRKAVAKTHTQIRQKKSFENAYRKLGQNNLDTIKNICKKFVNSIKQIEQDGKSETMEKMANITNNLKDEQDTIKEQEDIILNKRSDDKVACGQCNKLFDTVRDLTRHMTVKHGTTDRSKNHEDIPIVTIDDN